MLGGKAEQYRARYGVGNGMGWAVVGHAGLGFRGRAARNRTIRRAIDEKVVGADGRLAELVAEFCEALLAKLRVAEEKYGPRNEWTKRDWKVVWQRHLAEDLIKGDPRDVAIYAAFGWHHGWSTATIAAELLRITDQNSALPLNADRSGRREGTLLGLSVSPPPRFRSP